MLSKHDVLMIRAIKRDAPVKQMCKIYADRNGVDCKQISLDNLIQYLCSLVYKLPRTSVYDYNTYCNERLSMNQLMNWPAQSHHELMFSFCEYKLRFLSVNELNELGGWVSPIKFRRVAA